MAEGDKHDELEQQSVEQGEAAEVEDEAVRARRRLLKLTVYSAPVVLGTVLLSKDALAQQAQSCNPQNCNPRCDPRANCTPLTCPPAPCNPKG
jgi:hypothetical protein